MRVEATVEAHQQRGALKLRLRAALALAMITPEMAASPKAASASTTTAPVRRASESAALALGSTIYFKCRSELAAAFRAWIWPMRPAPNRATLNMERSD